MLTSFDLRNRFLKFFIKKSHTAISSASLLPINDNTLLFINSGMAPLKTFFAGKNKIKYKNIVNYQKCIRVGGKHNDLGNVGRTMRHQTFFEMLGSFSFGGYFKKKACIMAWDFLIKDLNLNPEKLSVTVFGGENGIPRDFETEEIWYKNVGLKRNLIIKKGIKDNFWSMGNFGPCGPCTEIFYDRGPLFVGFNGQRCDNKVEVWNIVFMQYNKEKTGKMTLLSNPCVDTGMGLERLSAIVNKLKSNYDTDLIKPIINFITQVKRVEYLSTNSIRDVAIRVVADHSRSICFLIADGILPSNDGRGYILRKIIRRAIRYGIQLGFEESFLYDTCKIVVNNFSNIYPELIEAKSLIKQIVFSEEEVFQTTLVKGVKIFNKVTNSLKKYDFIDGGLVYKLYETYGLPPKFTSKLAKEKKLNIFWSTFNKERKNHQKKSKNNNNFSDFDSFIKVLQGTFKTNFFYNKSIICSKIQFLYRNNRQIKQVNINEIGIIILDKTVFYAESGGQIGDIGFIKNEKMIAKVLNTNKYGNIHVHRIQLIKGLLRLNDNIVCFLDNKKRSEIKKHHSATHLLYGALKLIIGSHIIQKGSFIEHNRLRFDYAHYKSISEKELLRVESLINKWIFFNKHQKIKKKSVEEAKKQGILLIVNKSCSQKVRVVSLGRNSLELCSGTHVKRTGDIGCFKILSDNSISKGVRRIQAVAGNAAILFIQREHFIIKNLCCFLDVNRKEILFKIKELVTENKKIKIEINKYKLNNIIENVKKLAKESIIVGNYNLLIKDMIGITSVQQIKKYINEIKKHIQKTIIVFYIEAFNQFFLFIAITVDLKEMINANVLIQYFIPILNGKGGGNVFFAKAKGNKIIKKNVILNTLKNIILKN